MAKKDKSDKHGSDKGRAKPGRIPKSVGGLKLPKQLRRSGEKLIEKAQTPEGRRMIAAGLAMAGAAVARAKTPPAAPVPPPPAVGMIV